MLYFDRRSEKYLYLIILLNKWVNTLSWNVFFSMHNIYQNFLHEKTDCEFIEFCNNL